MIRHSSSAEVRCTEAAPGRARRILCDLLDRLGLLDAFPDAPLVLSELVTNAVLHSDCDLLRVDFDVHNDGRLRLAVTDTDPAHPVVRKPAGGTSVGGRGLMIVDTIASDWGVEATFTSKAVWAEMHAR